jgi:hypothetical protein
VLFHGPCSAILDDSIEYERHAWQSIHTVWTWFINEVMAESQICVYARMVARSAMMIHYLMFMVNNSTGKLTAHFECVNALVDLQARKTTPYPAARSNVAVCPISGRRNNRESWTVDV